MILGNIENQTLLALLAYALFAQEMNIDATNVNWDQVIAEANRHGRAHRPEAPRNPRRFLRSGAHRIEAVQPCDTSHFQYAASPVYRLPNTVISGVPFARALPRKDEFPCPTFPRP